MYAQQAQRDRFADGGLATASGSKIIQLCFERLDRDLDGAVDAIAAHHFYRAHDLLCHAQDLVFELLCMLDLEAWEPAADLARIYGYVLELLAKANISKIAKPANEARMLLASLGDGFRQAAAQLAAAPSAHNSDRARGELSLRA